MSFCTNCGYEVEDGINVCPNCGAKIENTSSEFEENKRDYSKTIDSFKEVVKDSAGKAISGTQTIASQLNKKVEEKKQSITAKAEADVQKMKEEQKKEIAKNVDNTKFMSSTELWSWLKQSSKRQIFYTENESELTESEFMTKLNNKITENNVPALIEQRVIQWDRSVVKRSCYFIKPITNVINPLTYLVQFNHIGKFTFVEEKSFITPPDLPEVPMKPLPLDGNRGSIFNVLIGVCIIFLGIVFISVSGGLGLVLLIMGGLITYFSASGVAKFNAILEHNKKCEEQEKAWNAAWSNWETSIFLHSFQEDINGQLSRVYDSVFECIKQVNSEEFVDTKKTEQEENFNINELEQLIARRKDEYR